MKKTQEYEGRTITAETHKRGNRYTWSYQTDVGEIIECRGLGIHSKESALSEAIENAKSAIDSN